MSPVRGALLALATAIALGVAGIGAGPAGASALFFQPQLGTPPSIQFFGASPGRAPDEVWATTIFGSVPATAVDGQQISEAPSEGHAQALAYHDQAGGWQIVPVAEEHGARLPFTGIPSASYDGGLALQSAGSPTIITHDPGGTFAQAPVPEACSTSPCTTRPTGAALEKGESLSGGSVMFAAIDEQSGHTGALIVPEGLSSSNPGVVRYDGTGQAAAWTREPICATYLAAEEEACKPPAGPLEVKAIAAASAQNAWLLASGPEEPLMLFKRMAVSGSFVWVRSQSPISWLKDNDEDIKALDSGQMLTVTSKGVWVDAELGGEHADLSVLVEAQPGAAGQWSSNVLGRWCYPYPLVAGCEGSLGALLPARYSSFAWSGPGVAGTRIIAGLNGGALLRLQGGGDFDYELGGGGQGSANAAFTKSGESPPEGWVAGASGGLGEANVERVTSAAPAPALGDGQNWPLPFRRPLLAIAAQPGTTPGEAGAQALAVGDEGQIARFIPGQGWTPEFLYSGAGKVETPRLRGVAWPEPGRAYAVGDEGAMWLWRAETGLWEKDAAAPLGFHGNLTAVAFSPVDPAVGYAVGKQGVLLAYDKTWTQQVLPPGLEQANFTSVSFAGSEALVTYRKAVEGSALCGARSFCEVGGLIVNNGSGWEVDPSAKALLESLHSPLATVLSKVAGLPDGGAVAAGPGIVIERDSANSPWRFSRQPLPEAQNISALAAVRAGAEVRALVSIDIAPESDPNLGNLFERIDALPPPGFNQPFGLVGPDPLPYTGYLLRETPEGWQDLEQQDYPLERLSVTRSDLPDWPDPVLALDVSPDGSQGWAVGGQTGYSPLLPEGAQETALQTSAALRLGPGATPPQSTGVPIPIPSGEATFAVAGNARCEEPCAKLSTEGLGPNAWLSSAVSAASRISGLRAFLYTGGRVAGASGRGLGSPWNLEAEQFTREMQGYADDLSQAGSLPVRVAPSPSDVGPEGGLSTFLGVLGPDAGEGSPSRLPDTGAYAFDSGAGGNAVRVIVLDDSVTAFGMGEVGWLEAELAGAKEDREPAIVMGNAELAAGATPDYKAVEQALLNRQHGASAYVYDTPNENSQTLIGSGSNAIPAFGTGTLGYVPPPPQPQQFLGASGFLLASVNTAQRNAATNRAPVTVELTPDIAELALNATDGTLLRRSQPALFEAVARRPFGGTAFIEGSLRPEPYVTLPETCTGPNCARFIEPSYTFTSSNPEIGNFVERETSNLETNPLAVRQGPDEKPIPDAHSGLFCAFNPGTTTVTITTGGLSYSEQVTVQGGSVEQPCGTVPVKNPLAAAARAGLPVAPLPPSTPAGSSPTPVAVPPPPVAPAAPAPPAVPPAPRPAPPVTPFFAKPLPLVALIALPLLPPPVAARPIPPSGTSAVTEPAVKVEEEDEEAVENARASMAAYDPHDPTLPGVSLLALILIAAGAGTGIRRASRSRRARRAPVLARAQARRYDWPS
ncbi:MAG: hypothetical protein ACLQMH_10845 [Solirubrobacteraceae bacterium]